MRGEKDKTGTRKGESITVGFPLLPYPHPPNSTLTQPVG